MERIGRADQRIKVSYGFDPSSPEEIVDIQGQVKAVALIMGMKPFVYDKNATAFGTEDMVPRTEPVMLDKWTAHGENVQSIDMVGLTVVIRGQGEVQDKIRLLLANEYDIDEPVERTGEAELYIFAARTASLENTIKEMESSMAVLDSFLRVQDTAIN